MLGCKMVRSRGDLTTPEGDNTYFSDAKITVWVFGSVSQDLVAGTPEPDLATAVPAACLATRAPLSRSRLQLQLKTADRPPTVARWRSDTLLFEKQKIAVRCSIPGSLAPNIT